MTLGQLRAFLAVARTGSVRAAAETLFISEPSVSAAVAALERHLGAELLERHGRGVRLTAAGETLARYAGEALGLLEQGVDSARHEARPGTGRLRLAAVTTAGEYIVPVALRAFLRRHPHLEPSRRPPPAVRRPPFPVRRLPRCTPRARSLADGRMPRTI